MQHFVYEVELAGWLVNEGVVKKGRGTQSQVCAFQRLGCLLAERCHQLRVHGKKRRKGGV